MGYVAGGEVVNAAPPVFCAYMGVLAALATTEAGAQVGLQLYACIPLFAHLRCQAPQLTCCTVLTSSLLTGALTPAQVFN